ncbi:hypothetical protein ACOMHN_018750 [Nucella lapillus]
MKTLPGMERELLERFKEVLEPLAENAATVELRRKIANLKRVNTRYVKNTDMMENPFHAFRLIKRMVKQWSSVFRASKGLIPEFFNSTRNWLAKQGAIWPSVADLSGAAAALVRLHHIYNLDYDALQRGRFLNVTSPPMTSQELSYVTKAALELGYVCDAKELLTALERAGKRGEEREEEEEEEEGKERREGGSGASLRRLSERLSDMMVGTVTECDHNNHNKTFNVPSIESLSSASLHARKEAVRAMYHHICRRAMESSVLYGSGRWCYWHSSHIPYLRFKAEMVNSDPFIVVFHDVISDDETRELKDLSFGMISPSALAIEQVEHETHLVRVSQNAWLFDTSPAVSRLSSRVQLVTGLSTHILQRDTHAEPYQVLNYGLGGVYGPHEDSVRVPRQQGKENHAPHLKNAGDRMATWMYYGTAVLWYNLKRSGHADVRTVHAGCPVLYGDKWVANKWLREAGHMFSRPCLLDPDL